ncbi:MAG: ATP-binding protein [Candidatus Acidiferrales bacterium]
MTDAPMPIIEFETDDLLVRLNFSGRAEIATINPIVIWVMDFVRGIGCAAGKEFEVELALREALSNAVVHGSKNNPEKLIEFCVACDKERGLIIVVRDQGEGFDPAKIASPTVGQNLFQDHGRGIYLINQLMDEVKFERGGTEIHMRKR